MASTNHSTFPHRPELFGNIVFVGGSSAMPGFGQRLQHEVQLLAPPGVCARVMSRADPLLATWQGGAAFASQPEAFDGAWLTSQQYEEHGTTPSTTALSSGPCLLKQQRQQARSKSTGSAIEDPKHRLGH